MILRTAFVLLAAAGLAACRQASLPAAGPGDPSVVPEVARAAHDGRPVLFVGLDGADWELLDAYIREGRCPISLGVPSRASLCSGLFP